MSGRTPPPGPGRPALRRPTVANPYDLSTWRGTQDRTARDDEPVTPARGATGVEVTARDRVHAVRVDQEAHGSWDGEVEDPWDEQTEQLEEPAPEQYDPVELPAGDDPFELARRTVNRSRAAARDRGLFPISAKTQARDARDRSGSAPGYSGARPDPRDPQGIQLVLRRVLGDLGWTAGMSAGRVLEEWDEIVGERVSANCRPVSFDEGVLVVSASSSAWASQLRMLTPQLITTIEEHIGSHVVSELRVTGPAAAQRTWKKGRRTVTWRGPRDTYG